MAKKAAAQRPEPAAQAAKDSPEVHTLHAGDEITVGSHVVKLAKCSMHSQGGGKPVPMATIEIAKK